MIPQTGDVLVSKSSARVEHDVSIVPAEPVLVCPTHDTAVEKARELARDRRVDAWLTEDHVHFLKLATYRAR